MLAQSAQLSFDVRWLALGITVLTLITGYYTLVVRVGRPHFRDGVFRVLEGQMERFSDMTVSALKQHPEKFRAWNDAQYADWRVEQVQTAQLARETHEMLTTLSEQFLEHRQEVRENNRLMAGLPQAFEHIAEAVKQVNATVSALDARQQSHATEIALLKAAVPRRRRAD